MSNIFEALEQAQLERIGKKLADIVPLPEEAPAENVRPTRIQAMGSEKDAVVMEMVSLYRTIDMMLPNSEHKTVQFIGSQQGEGVSTIVMEFARAVATKLGLRVLVLDAAYHNPVQHLLFGKNQRHNRSEAPENRDSFEKGYYQTGLTNLCIAPLTTPLTRSPLLADVNSTVAFLAEWKKVFDLVLIDSSPAATAPDGVALARHVDGVILVLEAERTQWGDAETVKERILVNGGKILGVVFNKYRTHVPEFVRRLIC